jgi:hypothetical protein
MVINTRINPWKALEAGIFLVRRLRLCKNKCETCSPIVEQIEQAPMRAVLTSPKRKMARRCCRRRSSRFTSRIFCAKPLRTLRSFEVQSIKKSSICRRRSYIALHISPVSTDIYIYIYIYIYIITCEVKA